MPTANGKVQWSLLQVLSGRSKPLVGRVRLGSWREKTGVSP